MISALPQPLVCFPEDSIIACEGNISLSRNNPQINLEKDLSENSVDDAQSSVIVKDINVEEELLKTKREEKDYFKILSMSFYGRAKSLSEENHDRRRKPQPAAQEELRVPLVRKSSAPSPCDRGRNSLQISNLRKSLLKKDIFLNKDCLRTPEQFSKPFCSTKVSSLLNSCRTVKEKENRNFPTRTIENKPNLFIFEDHQRPQTGKNKLPDQILYDILVSKMKSSRRIDTPYALELNLKPQNSRKSGSKSQKKNDKKNLFLFDSKLHELEKNCKENSEVISSLKAKSRRQSSTNGCNEAIKSNLAPMSFHNNLSTTASKCKTRNQQATEDLKKQIPVQNSKALIESKIKKNLNLQAEKGLQSRLTNYLGSEIVNDLSIKFACSSRNQKKQPQKDDPLHKDEQKRKKRRASLNFERRESADSSKFSESMNNSFGNWGTKSPFLSRRDYSLKTNQSSKRRSPSPSFLEKDATNQWCPVKIEGSNKWRSSFIPSFDLPSSIVETRASKIFEAYGKPKEKKTRTRPVSPAITEITKPLDLLEKFLFKPKK